MNTSLASSTRNSSNNGAVLVLLLASCGGTASTGGDEAGLRSGSSSDASRAADAGGTTSSGDGSGRKATPDAASSTDGSVHIGPSDDATGFESGAADSGSDASRGDGGDASGNGLPAVNLRSAGNFVILAKTGISTVPTSGVVGDLGVSPAAASYITGFSLVADPTNVFSTSPQVTGKVYASSYAPPTPSNLTTAVSDMLLAFTDAAGRPATVTELGAGNIGGMTLSPGVYSWSTSVLVPTDITLSGDSTGVWIFQVAQDLTVSSATQVALSGGGLAQNVFWQVAGSVDLGTTSHLEGVVLGQTSIALKTGASVHGRLLAQTAVNIEGSSVVQPSM